VVVIDNQTASRWYLRIYDSETLLLQNQIDVTEWNPRLNRIETNEDSITIPPHFRPTLIVAPGGRIAAIGNLDNSFRLIDLSSRHEIAHGTLARLPYFFTANGTELITNGGAGMRIWSLLDVQ
jgi:hypothetical protein